MVIEQLIMDFDKCYFCGNIINDDYMLLSCSKHCFKKCHLKCFHTYENYLVSLIGYPPHYSLNSRKQLMWTHDYHLICERLPCNCKNESFLRPHQDNPESLFNYGTNFNFAQHQLKKNK